MSIDTTDREIRSALHKKHLRKYHSNPDTLVIDELGLAHGRKRIDIAVLNGVLHGFEIKSSKDTLNRFPDQFHEYQKSLEKLTVVAPSSHMEKLAETAPEWCGLLEVDRGYRGGLNFSCIRKAKLNPNTSLTSLAHLLWRSEVIELLSELGLDESQLVGSKAKLYQLLPGNISQRELSVKIKDFFAKRENWRADPQLSPNGD